MSDSPDELIQIAGISYPLVGVYDVPDATPFQPVATAASCIFEHFAAWQNGDSTVIDHETAASFGCPGAGYWMCGIQSMPTEAVADYLACAEGLKASTDVMCRWLKNLPPYTVHHSAIVVAALREDQTEFLKTVTFFVNPDQLALLLTGAEYLNASPRKNPVIAQYGSGCGQLLTLFPDLDEPLAVVGATDIAMRKHLPQDTLAFTMTKPMFEQLCRLDDGSFLHKTFWRELQQARQ